MPKPQRAIMRNPFSKLTFTMPTVKTWPTFSTKNRLIVALVLGILAVIFSLVFMLTDKNSLTRNVVRDEIKTVVAKAEKPEPKKVEIDAKSQQEQKDADIAKILVLTNSLQSTLSGKRPLNSAFFKTLDKASSDLTELLKIYNLDDVKELRSLKNQSDIFNNTALLNQSLKKLSDAGNNLLSLTALIPSSNSFTNNNSFLDLQRIPKDSILRKMGEAMQLFAKNIDSVQKNTLDTEALTIIQQAIAQGVTQLGVLEEKSGTLNPQARDTLESLRQTPWSTKGPQLNKDIQVYLEQLSLLKKIIADSDALKIAAETPDSASSIKVLALPQKTEQTPPEAPGAKASNEGEVDYQKLAGVLLQISNDMTSPKTFSNQVFQNFTKWKLMMDEVLENAPPLVTSDDKLVTQNLPVKNQAGLVQLGRRVQESLNLLANLEKSANNLKGQGSTAAIMTAPSALLDLNKISVESPLRPLAMSFDDVQKANLNWQKNILDTALSAALNQAIDHTLEQITSLENNVQSQPPAVIEVLGKIRQIGWQSKAVDSKTTLGALNEQMSLLKKQLADPESITLAAKNKESKAIVPTFRGYVLLSWAPVLLQVSSLVFLISGLLGLRHSADSSAPHPTLIPNEDRVEKRTPYLSSPKETKPGQLVPALNEKIVGLEKKFIQSYQSSEKIMSYTQELMSKVTQLRTVQLGGGAGGAYVHLDASKPLEEIDAAIISLKQIGIRLFLSILENHSSRQLASETEEMNALVEKTEAAFADVKTLVEQINQKAVPMRHSSDQAGIDLLELDINLVLKEVKRWQNDLTDLNQTIMTLHELVGQYV